MNVERALIAQVITMLSPACVTVVDAVQKPWASVTFTGARHEITLLVEGENAEAVSRRLQRTLGCADFNISHQLVADIIVTNLSADAAGVRLDLEALTVSVD